MLLPLRTVRTIDILPGRGGFVLLDMCTFNPWHSVAAWTFSSIAAAEDHAWRCINFKEGRSMRVDDPMPADLLQS